MSSEKKEKEFAFILGGSECSGVQAKRISAVGSRHERSTRKKNTQLVLLLLLTTLIINI